MELLKDYSFVKGVNHYIDTDDERLRRELGYGSRVGLNSVRVWLWYGEYFRDPAAYIDKLVHFVRICGECGYTVMPILWNGNGIDPAILEEAFFAKGEEYTAAVVNALCNEPALLMWDVMNEPACSPYIDGSSGDEKNARLEKLWRFVRHFCRFVKKCDSKNALTVGYTTSYEAEPTVEEVDVISFHDYSRTRAGIRANYELAKKLSEKYGKQFMNTETGCLARSNPYDVVLEINSEYGCGYYLFELMIHGRCDSEHGIFYADGTVRDPSTISAIMGCYRNRSMDRVLPIPNREGAAEAAIYQIKDALREYTCDAFDYRRSDISKLLEACEFAANLLECCEMIELADPPSAHILAWRKEEKPNLDEIRRFAYNLANKLKDICQIL